MSDLPPRHPLNPPPFDPIGHQWKLVGATFNLDIAGSPTDEAATTQPIVCQLHESVRRLAAEFLPCANRLANTPGWTRAPAAARRLVDEVAPPTGELPARLALLYDAILSVAVLLDQDNNLRSQREQAARLSEVDRLDPETRAILENLVRIAAPWIRRFPTARAIDDDAGAYLVSPDLMRPARAFLDTAPSRFQIAASARTALATLEEDATHGQAQGGKAVRRYLGSAFNLGVKAFELLVAFELGMASNIHPEQSMLAPAISGMMLRGEHHFMAMVDVGQTDMKLALADMYTRLKSGHPLVDPTLVPADPSEPAEPPPGFSLPEVHRLILAGQPIPPPWRPFVTTLDFGPASSFAAPVDLAANFDASGIAKNRAVLRSLGPLATLANLEALELMDTEVSDLTPLSKLTRLQSLNLAGTEVTEIDPLEKLVNLWHLDLGYTPVTDITPLSKLVKLTHLDLGATQIRAVAPLAALTNLEMLDLNATRVSDVVSLATLTNLQVLDLRATQVTDVSSLAVLANLKMLDLSDTQVSDASMLVNVLRLYLPEGCKPVPSPLERRP